MWPWEHLAVGYIAYAIPGRLLGGRSPGNAEILLLAVATQVPDLIDKPLSWGLDVLPSGLSLGHSLFFAVPVTLALFALAWRRGRPGLGVAFGVGYCTHLLGDAMYPFLIGRDVLPAFLLWPLYYREADVPSAIGQVVDLATVFVAFLGTPRGRLYLLFEVLLLGSFLVLWVADGRPGLFDARRRVGDADDE